MIQKKSSRSQKWDTKRCPVHGWCFRSRWPRELVQSELHSECLDTVDLNVEFSRRVNGIKTVPSFLAGPFSNALRVALEEAAVGNRSKI